MTEVTCRALHAAMETAGTVTLQRRAFDWAVRDRCSGTIISLRIWTADNRWDTTMGTITVPVRGRDLPVRDVAIIREAAVAVAVGDGVLHWEAIVASSARLTLVAAAVTVLLAVAAAAAAPMVPTAAAPEVTTGWY